MRATAGGDGAAGDHRGHPRRKPTGIHSEGVDYLVGGLTL